MEHRVYAKRHYSVSENSRELTYCTDHQLHKAHRTRKALTQGRTGLFKLGTQYPCLQAMFTGRGHCPWTQVSKMTPVFTSRRHGRHFWTPVFTAVDTTREHGPSTGVVCIPSSSLISFARGRSSTASDRIVTLLQPLTLTYDLDPQTRSRAGQG